VGASLDSFNEGAIIVGKYKVTGTLGKGGMGFVLGARNLSTDERVALKFLLPSLRDDAEVSARFDQEARTAIRIKNQHVARVLDVVTSDHGPFIVMEQLAGEDLAAVLRKRGQLRVDESIDLMLQTCEAIHEAHLLGIVHRDLKPSNLFVTTSPHGQPFIKVLDFGISKRTTEDVSVTETRGVMGSPRYMPPEQLLSPKSVDARADVWSLGVILYEMLCATPPFPGDTYSVVHEAIMKGEYARLSSHRADIPPALEEAVAEALQIDRKKRVSTVEVLAEKLVRFGTDAARQTYALIQSRSAYALVEQAALDATVPTTAANVDPTLADPGTGPAVAESKAGITPSRRWPRGASVGVVAVAAAVAAFLPRVLARRARPDAAAASPAVSAEAPAPDLAGCTGGATPACEAACAAKVSGSCFELARALEKGTGAPRDVARAATLYQVECDANVAPACNNLGELYAHGDGVTHDDPKAVAAYKSACDLHSALGCLNLGAMHFEGNGVPRSEEKGATYFLMACDGGEPLGCLNVSVAYGTGRGVPKNLEESYEYAERACAGGALDGCVRVAVAKVLGEGVARDVKEGRAELKALCDKGEGSACEKLGGLSARGAGKDAPPDTLRTRAAVKKACEAGSDAGCAAQSLLSTVDRTSTTPAQISAMVEAKCDKGMLVACATLGASLLPGGGGPVDRPRGITLLRKACDGHVAFACEKLAAVKPQ